MVREQDKQLEIINKLAKMADLLSNISGKDFEKINQLQNVAIASLDLLETFKKSAENHDLYPEIYSSLANPELEKARAKSVNLLELAINTLIPRFLENSNFTTQQFDQISYGQALRSIKYGLHVFLNEAISPESV